jgi:hypothetical protein
MRRDGGRWFLHRRSLESRDFSQTKSPSYDGRVVDVQLLPDSIDVVAVDPVDEFLHLPGGAGDPNATETSFFGFNVPERNLNCLIHHRLHPPQALASGGVVLIQGEAGNAAFADYIDYHAFMPMPSGDLDDIVYPSGVRVQVVKPLELVELSYASPDGRLRFELAQEALMPAAGRPDGGHFAQAMRTCGEFVLDGERIEIDGYFTREHRWSAAQFKDDRPTQSLAWASAVFGPDLALHFSARDGKCLERGNLRWGYVRREGETRPLEAVWMRTGRGADGAAPTGVEVRLLDTVGETHEMTGETRARVPLNVWPSVIDQMCLMQFRLNGRKCHGDFRDLQHNSFLRSTRS